jgi:hypothetical protein
MQATDLRELLVPAAVWQSGYHRSAHEKRSIDLTDVRHVGLGSQLRLPSERPPTDFAPMNIAFRESRHRSGDCDHVDLRTTPSRVSTG